MIVENEQRGSIQSFFYLEACCRLIGEKMGNSDVSHWTNKDYLRLSSMLSRDTEIQISASTLKRLFGKLKTPERYFPQRATRDALARFAGYKGWDDLIASLPAPGPVAVREEPVPLSVVDDPVRKFPSKYLWIAGVIFVGLAGYFFQRSGNAAVDLSKVRLVCPNPVGENPHSASFHLELPSGFKGDPSAFTINFGDRRRSKSISGSQVLTHYFEIPGRYYVVLNYLEQPVDTVAVYLQTNGWTATANMERDTVRVYPVKNELLRNENGLKVAAADLDRSGVDTNRTFFVHFVNARPFSISGDNFELQANLTTSELRPGVRCSQVILELMGEHARHDVMLIKPGCVSWAYLHFSEQSKNGENADLSSLGADLTGGGNIRLHIANKKVKLYIKHKLAYQTAYSKPVGELSGIKISFSGIGVLHNIQLRDLQSNLSWSDNLNQ